MNWSVALLSVLVLCATRAVAVQVCDEQSIMATAWKICLFDDSKSKKVLRKNIAEGMDEVRRIDRWMSEWKPNSLISQINANAGIKPVAVDQEALEVLKLCLKHSELTDGAFDISFNAFFGFYSFKQGKEKFPTQDEISRILPLVNYRNIILDEKAKTVFLKKKGMKIGLGGMGQGWAVDKVFAVLKKYKIRSGFIDGSGDTYFWGRKPDGKLWIIGVGDACFAGLLPSAYVNPADFLVLYKMYFTDRAVTTAGDTEKFFLSRRAQAPSHHRPPHRVERR